MQNIHFCFYEFLSERLKSLQHHCGDEFSLLFVDCDVKMNF